jgi:hypothetical protein
MFSNFQRCWVIFSSNNVVTVQMLSNGRDTLLFVTTQKDTRRSINMMHLIESLLNLNRYDMIGTSCRLVEGTTSTPKVDIFFLTLSSNT